MEDNRVKLFQIFEFFATKYSYIEFQFNDSKNISSEKWLVNLNNKYNIIRISLDSLNNDELTNSRIDNYLDYIKKALKNNEINFLDVHIKSLNKDIEDNNPYDHTLIDINYCDRKDILELFVGIDTCLKNSDNPENDIKNIKENILKSKKKKFNLFKVKSSICTTIISFICLIFFVGKTIIAINYDDVSAAILMGAEYKTFTIGLKQYYRLITYAFLHSGFMHLFCNLYSLKIVGGFVERNLGHKKFLLILFLSILFGSLTQGILTDNEICIGISAGLYGLSLVFFINIFKIKIINIRSLIPIIVLNLALNFVSSIAWTAHLGGLIGGYFAYTLINKEDKKDKLLFSLLIIICIIALFYKYLNPVTVTTYAGTDLKIIQILNDLNYHDISNRIILKLNNFYQKFGG